MRPALISAFALAAGMVAYGCGDLDGPAFDAPVTAEVRLTGTSTLPLTQLRLGAVYVSREFVEFGDVAVTSTTASISIHLTVPSEEVGIQLQVGLRENESVELTVVTFAAYLDRNETLNFDSEDLVLGTGSESPTGWLYMPDRAGQLEGLSLEAQLAFREIVADERTSFIPSASGFPTSNPSTLLIELEAPSERAFRLACPDGPVQLPLTETSSIVIEPGIDPLRACGVEADSCRSLPLELEGPVTIPDLPEVRAQCRPRSELEYLVIESRTDMCSIDSCSCRPASDVLAYVAVATSTPSWWPCGDTVTRCEADSSPLSIDSSCL